MSEWRPWEGKLFIHSCPQGGYRDKPYRKFKKTVPILVPFAGLRHLLYSSKRHPEAVALEEEEGPTQTQGIRMQGCREHLAQSTRGSRVNVLHPSPKGRVENNPLVLPS